MTTNDIKYDLRPCSLNVVRDLCKRFHAYGGTGNSSTYAFAVYENELPIAGYTWQPPPPGAARNVCSEMPSAVLALSRMVAVPRLQRHLKHISKPLRRQMRHLIDRGRWPILITYSDEGQGHTGHVYKCSGWQPTLKSVRPVYSDSTGKRTSTYSNGRHISSRLFRVGTTTIQRWEHWACSSGNVSDWMCKHEWFRVPVRGKTWKSGNQAYRWIG